MYLESAREIEKKCCKYKDFEIMVNHYKYDIHGLEFNYFTAQIERPGIYHEYENPSWIRRPVNRSVGFDNRDRRLSIDWVLNRCMYEIDKIISKEKKGENKDGKSKSKYL